MALKIVYMGTPEFAVPILKSINDSEHKILEVYTLSPRKKDRGKKIHNTPIHVFSNNNKLFKRVISCKETTLCAARGGRTPTP